MTRSIDILNQTIIRLKKIILFSTLFVLFIFSLNLNLFSQQDNSNTNLNDTINNNKINEYKLGLNFKFNNFVHRLNFNEFLSTNRPDFKFNNYTQSALQPEFFAEYKVNDWFNIGMNLSYLKFNYNDNIDEQFLVSNQGTPTLANIRTSTLTNFSTFSLSPKVSFNYENIALNGNFNVFFCLILT